MYAAYDALSAPMRRFIDGLSARHAIGRLASYSKKVSDTLGDRLKTWPSTIHPLVEVHPDTSRRIMKRVALVGHRPIGPNG
jgi:taurine dioxygenase